MFIDTSALAKLYHYERGTDVVEQLLSGSEIAFVSRLAVVEMQSVFSGKVHTGVLTTDDATLPMLRFRGDVRSGRFRVIALRNRHYQRAESLVESHGPLGLRTLDSLQLATILDLVHQGLATTLVTADHKLAKVAILEGLAVINPEDEPLHRD